MDRLVGQEPRRRGSLPGRNYEAVGSSEGGDHDLESEQR